MNNFSRGVPGGLLKAHGDFAKVGYGIGAQYGSGYGYGNNYTANLAGGYDGFKGISYKEQNIKAP